MTEKRWKAQERRVARLLGATRNPRKGTPTPDAESSWLAIENKDRRVIPQWIIVTVAKARARAGPKRLGIATLTTRDNPQVLVVIDLRDFKEWFGKTVRPGDY